MSSARPSAWREGTTLVFSAASGPEWAWSAPWMSAFVLTLAAAALWSPNFLGLLPIVLATVAHELGHAGMAWFQGVAVTRIEIGLWTGFVHLPRPGDPVFSKILVAGPVAHAAWGLATMALAWWLAPGWALVGGFVVFHAVGNLAPNHTYGPNDGAQLLELWLARGPPWARGVVVVGLGLALLVAAAVLMPRADVPTWVSAAFGLMGLLGLIGGADLLRATVHR